MRKKLLSKLMLLLCALLVGSASAWAGTKTGAIVFGTNGVKISSASVTGNDSQGNEWTITTEGTTSFTANAAYHQIGSKNSPATSITFTTTLSERQTITSLKAKFGGFSGTAGIVTLKVGDTTVGTGELSGTTDVLVESTESAEGTVLTVTVTDIDKGVKCYSINYTYEAEGEDPAPLETVATPTFTPEAGEVEAGTEVTIATTEGATIYYTTDGTTPTEESAVYSAPIAITEAMTIKAIAVKEGMTNSAVATAAYTIKAGEQPVEPVEGDYSYTFESSVFSENGTQELNGVEWTLDGDGGYWGYNADKGEQFGSGSKPYTELTLTTSGIVGTISEIKINASGANSIAATLAVTVGGEAFGEEMTLTSTATEYTFEGSGSGEIVIKITQTSSKALYIKSIAITAESGEGPAVVIAKPTFSVAEGSYLEPQTVAIACETEGAEIYYTIDGTEPSKESMRYQRPIPVRETTTIKAIAYVGEEASKVASVTLTFPEVYQSIAELIKAAPAEAYLKLTNAQVYYVNGKNMYIGDGEAALCFYNTSLEYTAGQRLNGILKVKYTVYKNLPEVTAVSENNLVVTAGEPTSVVMNVADVDASKASILVEVKGTIVVETVDTKITTYVADEIGTKVKLYDNFKNGLMADLAEGDEVVVKGIVIVYNEDLEIAPISLSVSEGSINVELPAAGYATYVPTVDVSFNASGVSAYTAKVNGAYVTLTEVNEVPAGTAVILKADAGTYQITKTSEVEAIEGNELLASDGNVKGDGTIYALGYQNEQVGFYLMKKDEAVPAGKAYLKVAAADPTQGVREFLAFAEGETDGIQTLSDSLLKGENIYSLSGQRVQKAQKGIYIVNGKKIMVK